MPITLPPVITGATSFTGVWLTGSVVTEVFVASGKTPLDAVWSMATYLPAAFSGTTNEAPVDTGFAPQVAAGMVAADVIAELQMYQSNVEVGAGVPVRPVALTAVRRSPTCALPVMLGGAVPKAGAMRIGPMLLVNLVEVLPLAGRIPETVTITRAAM